MRRPKRMAAEVSARTTATAALICVDRSTRADARSDQQTFAQVEADYCSWWAGRSSMRTGGRRTVGVPGGLGPQASMTGEPVSAIREQGTAEPVGRTKQHANRSTLIAGDPLPGRLTSSRAKRGAE
jgi:hypothetical protein